MSDSDTGPTEDRPRFLRQRQLVNLLTGIALVLLPFGVVQHLRLVQTNLEQGYVDALGLFQETSFLRTIDQLVLAAADGAVQDSARGEGVTRAVRAASPDPLALDQQCGESKAYGLSRVWFGCASVAARKTHSVPSEVLVEIERRRVPALLAAAYRSQPTGVLTGTEKDLPLLLFVYLTTLINGQEVAVYYPALRLDDGFDFTERTWYKRSRSVGSYLVSPVYKDYSTNALVISVTKRSTEPTIPVRVVTDLRVPARNPAFGAYALNALFALIATVMYLRYHISSSGAPFQRYMFLSAASILVSYTFLTVNDLVAGDQPYLTLNDWLEVVVAFLPGGSLLATAATALRRGYLDHPRRVFWTWYSVEFATGVISSLLHQPLIAATFSSVALFSLADAFLGKRRSFSEPFVKRLTPNPRSICIFAALAYSIWGLAQFSIVLLNQSSSITRYALTWLGPLADWAELLAGPPGVFALLLFAKGVAIFLTILYLGTINLVRYRRELELQERRTPHVETNRAGQITGVFAFGDLERPKISDDLPNLVSGPAESRELRLALASEEPLYRFMCRIPSVFGNRVVALRVEDGHDSTRCVSFSPVEEDVFLGRLAFGLSNQLRAFGRRLSDLVSSAKGGPIATGNFDQLQALLQEQQVLMEDAVFQGSAWNKALHETKLSTEDAVAVLAKRVQHFSGRYPLISVQTNLRPESHWPKTLRINMFAFATIVDLLLGAFAEGKFASSEGRIEVDATFDRQPESSGYLSFMFRLRGLTNARDSELWREVRSSQDPASNADTTWALLNYLLGFFNGHLRPASEVNDGLDVAVRIRFYGSTLSTTSSGNPS